jgi:hypothetical protein
VKKDDAIEHAYQQSAESRSSVPPTTRAAVSESHDEVAESARSAPRAERSHEPPQFVYAVGKIEPRFPNLAVEKEMNQAAAQLETSGKTTRQLMKEVLTQRSCRYLARSICWVFSVSDLETYLLAPRDPQDFELLCDSVRDDPSPMDLDVVIGVRGPIAPPEACNGLMLPMVFFDQLYSFDRDSLLESIPFPEDLAAKDQESFRASARELLGQLIRITDNAGSLDQHRALNYIAVRYGGIYAKVAEAHRNGESLLRVDVRSSPLSGARRVVDAIFSFVNRGTDVVQKNMVRIDVTEEFPFLVTKLAPYFEM